MLVKVEAHHSKSEHFMDVCRKGAKEVLVDNLSDSHILIGTTTYNIGENYPDEAICEDAFMTFNWMTKGRDGAAPQEVNEKARDFQSHASMSVGDIVVIHRAATISIWKCLSYGWQRIISFQTGIAGTPEV